MSRNVVTVDGTQSQLINSLPEVWIAVVVSRYNAWVTDRLLQGAIGEAERRLGERARIIVAPVAGAFEIPVVAAAAARGKVMAVVALGCIIKGETIHDEVIAHAVTRQLAGLAVRSGRPVGLGLLTVNNAAQAEARAGGAAGNKGAEAMAAALDALSVRYRLSELSG